MSLICYKVKNDKIEAYGEKMKNNFELLLRGPGKSGVSVILTLYCIADEYIR